MIHRSKKHICFLIAIVYMLNLCACQKSPEHNIVTSKNDGSFDINVVHSATESTNIAEDENGTLGTTQKFTYSNTFFSTDGTVEFIMNIDKDIQTAAMPVVEVAPYYLSEKDAQRVANILFENAVFYEAEPKFDVLYSKEDIQTCINRWLPYTDVEALSSLLGIDSHQHQILQPTGEAIKKAIADFTAMYEDAPTEGSLELREWSFKPDSYFSYSKEDLYGEDLSQDNEKIAIDVISGDIQYYLAFTKRNKSDYKLNYIYAYPYSYFSPHEIDTYIFNSQLRRTDKPTEEQINFIKEYAQNMLDRLELGDWIINKCTLQTTYVGKYPEYSLDLTAVPLINGVPVASCPQYTNLKSPLAYASNYYLSEANISFSANGDLLRFEMLSTIEVKRVINSNVATLSMNDLMSRAASHLSLSDYHQYGIGGELLELLEDLSGEKYICKVEICDMEYGMLRVKVPNTDDSYYYVPGIVLYGSVDYFGSESGILYESSGTTIGNARISPLLAFNAVDGSVIELYID